jgi:hypothetical protein
MGYKRLTCILAYHRSFFVVKDEGREKKLSKSV